MSSFNEDLEMQRFYVRQSGLAMWEEIEPIGEWGYETTTICAVNLLQLIPILKAVVLSTFPSTHSVFRLLVNPIPDGIGATQKRRLIKVLGTDIPGFSWTHVAEGESAFCVSAKLTALDNVDLKLLSSYRRSILLVTDSSIDSPCALCEALNGSMSDLGGVAIQQLLGQPHILAVLRVLDMETHAALQILAKSNVIAGTVHALESEGINRVYDIRTIAAAINAMS